MPETVDSRPSFALAPRGRLQSWLATATVAHGIARRALDGYRERTRYTTTIDSRDELYHPVLAVVLDRIEPGRRRSVELVTRRNGGEPIVDSTVPGDEPRVSNVQWVYEGSRQSTLILEGHRVGVHIDDGESLTPGLGDDSRSFIRPKKVRFTAQSPAARDAVHRFLITVAESRVRRSGPAMRIASRWGHWNYRGDLPARSLDTVILADGVRELITGDLERFLAAEARYADLGVPWHRGYLLHGPPGTGKTSLTRALASHYGLGLHYIPLADMSDDANLLDTVAQVPPRSLLLLEDADVYHAARLRDDTQKGTSLGALLNALDGVFTPHGLITVMTTNRRDALDAALLRPGRVDLEVHLNLAGVDQTSRLFELAYGHGPAFPHRLPPAVAPAEVVEVLLAWPDEPWEAERALHDLRSQRVSPNGQVV